jgi:F420-non-reducing hydrogenase small subunit
MTPDGRRRFAMYWAAGCGGCDIAVLNVHEAILDFAEHFEIVFWPAVMDAKYADLEAMPDGSIDLTLFTGGIRNTENAELARLLRRKSTLLVAFGSCATEGCIPGLANLRPVDDMLRISFDGPTTDNPAGLRPETRWAAPEGELRLPALLPFVRTLDQVVPVDYFVPGCPPESARIAEVLGVLIAVAEGKAELPPAGAVLGAGHSTVCDECRRDRGIKRLTHFGRIQEMPALDPGLCILEQGLPCNGPATRDGCGAKCPLAGAPCIGCYGPADGVVDFGARLMSAFASVVDASEAETIDRILDGLPDPVGQFYRFSLAGSLLRGARSVMTEPPTGAGSAAGAESPAGPAARPAAAAVVEPALVGSRGADR